MNARSTRIALMGALCLIGTQAQAVVESGHWQVSSASAYGNLAITVDQTVGGDYTGSFFNYNASAGTLQFVTRNVDEGAELFVTTPGNVLSNATISALPASATFQSTALKVGQDFYLGARTRSFSDPGFTWADPAFFSTFGWAHFKLNAQGSLQIVDSAMAFRETGIIAGTTQAIPEPATWALMGLGLAALAVRQRAKVRQGI
jgi:PEP-CTERM motif